MRVLRATALARIRSKYRLPAFSSVTLGLLPLALAATGVVLEAGHSALRVDERRELLVGAPAVAGGRDLHLVPEDAMNGRTAHAVALPDREDREAERFAFADVEREQRERGRDGKRLPCSSHGQPFPAHGDARTSQT